MAYITECNTATMRYMFTKIKVHLRQRGLRIIERDEWEVHGSHFPELQYQVFVGPAMGIRGSFSGYVAIYPGTVYEIDSSEFWHRPKGHEGETIRILKKRR